MNQTASILFVGGRFDKDGGRPSGFISRLRAACWPEVEIELHNGGTLSDLEILIGKCHAYRAVWWMPDIDNTEPKLVGTLKDACPKSVLVISKNNRSDKYEYHELFSRMLKARANMMLEIRGDKPPFTASVLDPLGNAYIVGESNIRLIADALLGRTMELLSFRRMGSVSIGPAQDIPDTPEVQRFIQIMRGYAETFHDLVHGANPSRFLGNASFRCTKGGFPAFRVDNEVFYVSRRNLDKRELATDGFVAARLAPTKSVEYFGDAKPSVDAPIQREIFRLYPSVRFMLHAHVYVEGAPFTTSCVPCGAMDEVSEIIGILGGQDIPTDREIPINLLGHGCLILSHDPEHLAGQKFIARPVPERPKEFWQTD